MKSQVYLITPPFTQLNTPYPATPYIKGFLNTLGVSAFQSDLGLDVILTLFSKEGLHAMFNIAQNKSTSYSSNAARIVALKEEYLQTITPVIAFLQGKNPTIAHRICQGNFLPQASRFQSLQELDWAFGSMGIQDQAKHLATLYLEDISDFIIECIDPHFGFSRYAERLGRSANSFNELYETLNAPLTFIDELLVKLLSEQLVQVNPELVVITVPFPGNLYSAFRCGQWIKKHAPQVKVAMGGGFANTELRSLSDTRVFEFFDFISLDDGEAPIEHLLQHLKGERDVHDLKRTFVCLQNHVVYCNGSKSPDYKQAQVGTPDYSNLKLEEYISVIEIVNPMHRMWSDGRWNKLTMAHGCYWGKCTFCDISLDYIKLYEPVAASLLCDRMEQLMQQTGHNGFHFVDEAAPPALMKALALEILKRKLVVSWWTNIRFEKSLTQDLCLLLKASGCIAVSGGLEVASDRLLALIQKGVTVSQVARVTQNFTESGIMVHAYLMYGFPTQTAQETIDSLEMVRQMFELNILQSGFWHQFAMTAHSPVGMNPEAYQVTKENTIGTFANNDLVHQDPLGAEHELFSYGLKKSLFNYMHGICFDYPLQEWFNFKVPRTKVAPDYIQKAIANEHDQFIKPNTKLVWIGGVVEVSQMQKTKKNKSWSVSCLTIYTKEDTIQLEFEEQEIEWLKQTLARSNASEGLSTSWQTWKQSYEALHVQDFELFWYSKSMLALRKQGLLMI